MQCARDTQVKQDLAKARDGFVLSTDLHLTFLSTPVQEPMKMGAEAWSKYDGVVNNLSDLDARVAQLVGVNFKFIQVSALAAGAPPHVVVGSAGHVMHNHHSQGTKTQSCLLIDK